MGHGAVVARPLARVALAIIAVAVVFCFLNPGAAGLMRGFDWDGSLMPFTGLAIVVTPLSIVLHELSHCFAASVWGIRRGTLRVHLYLGIFPIVALKFAGLYTLPSRGRIVVWSAGVFTNLSIAAVSRIALDTVVPHSPVLEVAVTVNWLMAILNLVPLLPTDGYFLLTTLTRNPNVRVQAWDLLRNPFRLRQMRSSWLVLVYFAATIYFLIAAFWHYAVRLVNYGGRFASWQSWLSVLFLGLFVFMLIQNLRKKGEYE